ncbi:hypothetical protein SK128_028493 [Halocaridina rubra]|uniref:Uncharacterized protein n=1 Tax=Halocaridina rubra TaxID=373956 RepID=A0AAN8ZV25_HALRR
MLTSQLLLLLVLIMEGAAGSQLVPQIPDDVQLGITSTYNIWAHALRQQKDSQGQPVTRTDVDIKTLLSPDEWLMINLAPMDGPHPLYSNDNTALRTEFLLDYVIADPVQPNDEKMSQPDGLVVPNLSGKSLTFRKDSEGKITVEGIDVTNTKTLSNGITVYTLSNFLFDHRERIQEALEKLLSNRSNFGPFGRGAPMPPRPY